MAVKIPNLSTCRRVPPAEWRCIIKNHILDSLSRAQSLENVIVLRALLFAATCELSEIFDYDAV
jgi:hypothetical protein